MISLLGVTRKNYTVTLDHGQSVSGTVSVDRRQFSIARNVGTQTVSLAPYGTSEALRIGPYGSTESVNVLEVTNVSGALASFPRSE